MDYPIQTPPLILRIKYPPPIVRDKIKFPAMNKVIKYILLIYLVLSTFYCSILCYLYNDVEYILINGELSNLTIQELNIQSNSRFGLILGASILSFLWIRKFLKNPHKY